MRAALLALVLAATGCISAAAVVPVTPDNSQAMGTCQSIASQHNDLAIAGIALSGVATGLASAGAGEASSNPTAAKDIAITAAVFGGVAVVDAAMTGYLASQFANSNCSALVGPLPILPVMSKLPPADAGEK